MKDDVPGFINAVVLSDGFWHRAFGGDPKAIGKSLRLDGDPIQIIGVMPPGFHHPGKTLETEEDAYIAAGYNALSFPHPAAPFVRMLPGAIGRLKPGLASPKPKRNSKPSTQASPRIIATDYPPAAGWAPRLVSVQQDLTANVRTELFVLFAAVGFVLLIACVNLANLLLPAPPDGTAKSPSAWLSVPDAAASSHRCSRKASCSLSFPDASRCLPWSC